VTPAVAVARGPASTAIELARAGQDVTLFHLGDLPGSEAEACRRAGVSVEAAPELDVRVTARWLQDGYRLYRAVAGRAFDAVVFDGNAADAYCAGRARETTSALEATSVVVRTGTPMLERLEEKPFVTHHELGAAVTEQLALSLADVVVDGSGLVEAMSQQPSMRIPSREEQPLVSVVVPLYERTSFLPQCLETLARQDYPRLEVVVADDGSASRDVALYLEELVQRSWPWTLRVERLPHGGLASARNGGWRAASGELVLFLDDDDAAFDDLVTRTVRARAAADADVVVAGARTFDGEGPPEPRSGDRVTISLCDPGLLTLFGNHSGGPTCLWQRSWLERLDGFKASPRVVEDWHILVRASLAGARITTPPDPAWWYRRTPTSMFGADPHGALDAALPAMSALLAETPPPHARLLPHLAAGAYRQIERTGQAEQARPPGARSLARGVAARLRGRR
jgi:hypothetical protein